MLLAERTRQLDERLQAEGASAQVQQRHRDNARLIREGLGRIYAAAAPITTPRTDSAAAPLDAAGRVYWLTFTTGRVRQGNRYTA